MAEPAGTVAVAGVARTGPRVAARQADARRRILEAARSVVSEQGVAAAQVAVVASVAEVATGSIYRHFPSRASLLSEMLRVVCLRELEVVQTIVAEPGRSAVERLGDAVATFVDRALRGEGLAHAMIVEPMDPEVDQVRLEARAALAGAFAGLIREGSDGGEFAVQDADIRGAGPTPPPRSSTTTPRRSWSARRARVCARSCPPRSTPASTSRSAPRG